MTRPRCLGRLAAAGTGVLAASALALAAAPAAGAQGPIPSPAASATMKWNTIPLRVITNPCDLPSRPCDLYWEEPSLIPDPVDRGDLIVPVSQVDLAAFQLPELQGPGLAFGG